MSGGREVDDWVPMACTLPTALQPVRVAEFDDLFEAVRAGDRPDPTRLVLSLSPAPGGAEMVRDSTGRESECCSFFTCTLVQRDELLMLEVTVPAARVDALDAVAERAARAGGGRPSTSNSTWSRRSW